MVGGAKIFLNRGGLPLQGAVSRISCLRFCVCEHKNANICWCHFGLQGKHLGKICSYGLMVVLK